MIYIGFSVDMDRAHTLYNNHGSLIPQSDSSYSMTKYYNEDFIEKTNALIKYFYENKYEKAVTWFINEADYNITIFFKDILKKCLKDGEAGLHTHFNSVKFNATIESISDDPNDWLQNGIVDPTNKLKQYVNANMDIKVDNILCFKAGNHMRNDNMYESIAQNNYTIDCTKVLSDCMFGSSGTLLFDDRDIMLGTEPFFIKTSNKDILEIPEIRVGNVINHVKQCIENNKIPFIKLQIHHWQYDELIPKFEQVINELKKHYELKFVSLVEMQRIYFNKIMMDTNTFIKQYIDTHPKLSIDSYYSSLKNVYDANILDVMIYIFNNYKNNAKIIELFSGIGQTGYLLTKIGFNNVTILDFSSERLNYFEELKSVYADFFTYSLDDYDCVFMTNCINTCLCDNIDKQIIIYDNFLKKKENNVLIINYVKYGDYSMKYSKILIDYLKNKYTVTFLNSEYVVIKNILDCVPHTNFSSMFNSYKLINFNNVNHKLIIEYNQKIIHIELSNNINGSFGIYFPIYEYQYGITHLDDCVFKFECKSDKPIKIKIYNGCEWIKLSDVVTNEYTQISIKTNFIFNTKSTYRIGFYDVIDNTNCYIKNVLFEI